jgi:hypothetical protein
MRLTVNSAKGLRINSASRVTGERNRNFQGRFLCFAKLGVGMTASRQGKRFATFLFSLCRYPSSFFVLCFVREPGWFEERASDGPVLLSRTVKEPVRSPVRSLRSSGILSAGPSAGEHAASSKPAPGSYRSPESGGPDFGWRAVHFPVSQGPVTLGWAAPDRGTDRLEQLFEPPRLSNWACSSRNEYHCSRSE